MKMSIHEMKRKDRVAKPAAIVLGLLLLLPLCLGPLQPSMGEERSTDRIVLLYTGETHGNAEPCG